jgi:hypothetical protein
MVMEILDIGQMKTILFENKQYSPNRRYLITSGSTSTIDESRGRGNTKLLGGGVVPVAFMRPQT